MTTARPGCPAEGTGPCAGCSLLPFAGRWDTLGARSPKRWDLDSVHGAVPRAADELNQLKTRLLAMGGEAEEQVRAAVRALVDNDLRLAERVLCGDEPINRLHMEIDKRCYDLLVDHPAQPTDVRVIVSGVKINGDLERIGDVAVNIAEATFSYLQHPPVKPLIDIPRMADPRAGHAAGRAERIRAARHRSGVRRPRPPTTCSTGSRTRCFASFCVTWCRTRPRPSPRSTSS